jgi:hypothetical protein
VERNLLLSLVLAFGMLLVGQDYLPLSIAAKVEGCATYLSAQAKAEVTGVVTDLLSVGISDATISFYSTARVLQTKSDRHGEFRLTQVPIGRYEVEASHKGFKTKKFGIVEIAGLEMKSLAISLDVANPGCIEDYSISYDHSVETDGGTLEGRVASDRQELNDVQVELVNASEGRVVAARKSDEKGDFRFKDLVAGQYVLRVSKAGYHDEAIRSFWVTRENRTRVSVDMLKEGKMQVCQ